MTNSLLIVASKAPTLNQALQTKVLEDFYLALSLSGYGFLQLELGELDIAKASLTRALAIAEKKWGR